jgi:hypothetical protein
MYNIEKQLHQSSEDTIGQKRALIQGWYNHKKLVVQCV